jgi:hypothetical protein
MGRSNKAKMKPGDYAIKLRSHASSTLRFWVAFFHIMLNDGQHKAQVC